MVRATPPAPLTERPPSSLRLDATCAALLIVDVQERLSAAMPPEELAAVVRHIGILTELARRLGLPTVLSEQYPRGLGPTLPAVASAVAELPGLIRFEKTAFACTEEPGFDAVLARVARAQWLVVGMETHVCVWQTVRGLRERGLDVQVPADAVIARQRANHQVGLALAERAGALITSTETAAFDALVRAGSDDFKAISRLVK